MILTLITSCSIATQNCYSVSVAWSIKATGSERTHLLSSFLWPNPDTIVAFHTSQWEGQRRGSTPQSTMMHRFAFPSANILFSRIDLPQSLSHAAFLALALQTLSHPV